MPRFRAFSRPARKADNRDMASDLVLVVGGISAAWAVLGVIGGERQRVLQDARRAAEAASQTDAADPSKPTAPASAPKKALG